MTDNYDALRNAASPEAFCVALEAIACDLEADACELDHAWQNQGAGKPWHKLARSLDKVAATYGIREVQAMKPLVRNRRLSAGS